MGVTNFFAFLTGAVAMGGAGAAVAVPILSARQEAQPTSTSVERADKGKGEFKYKSNKKDWYCYWEDKWQCTPVFEIEAPMSNVDDESE